MSKYKRQWLMANGQCSMVIAIISLKLPFGAAYFNYRLNLLIDEVQNKAVPELKANMSSLKSVLSAPNEFLVKLMSTKQLTCLCLNVLKLIPDKFKLSKLAMRQILTMSNDQNFTEYLSQVRFSNLLFRE